MSDTEEHSETAEERDAESVAALEHGQLPVTARKRIEEAEASGGTWSSDLSVPELAAVQGVGFDPIGLVMGTSVYHIGWQWGPRAAGYSQQQGSGSRNYSVNFGCTHGYYHEGARTGYNWEQAVVEEGITTARNLAMTRLVEEARELGAHGVVGLRVRFTRPQGLTGHVEFVAIGTAIRRRGAPALPHPFTCHLSGQQFAKLMRIGLVPAAYVIGVAAIEVYPGCVTELQERSWVNQELDQPSAAAQACRKVAIDHLEREVRSVGDGVVGVESSFGVHHLGGGSELFELHLSGTAVRRFANEPIPAEPFVMLRLGDKR